METLLSLGYWLDVTPPPLSRAFLGAVFAVFALFVVAGLFARVRARRQARKDLVELFGRVGRATTTMGVIGLVLLFFSYEQIRFFGARFWYLLWLLIVLVWAAFIIHHLVRVLPKKRALEIARQEKEKYLPKPKK
jgi:amino acid transporter